MNQVLAIILLLLLIIIGGKRGFKTFISIFLNIFLLLILVILIGWGFNPLISTLIICLVISTIVLFFLNDYNQKTISSFIAVLITLIIFATITIIFNSRIYIQGYTEETLQDIGYVTYNTGLNMISISNCVIIIGLIGTIIDTSIAISSALNEIYQNNPKLSKKELFLSGMNIGKDILGTTTNTLFFAYLGGYMTMLIYFQDFQYDFSTIINSKLFAQEFVNILLSGLSSTTIIPLTSFITSYICKLERNNKNEKNEYNL